MPDYQLQNFQHQILKARFFLPRMLWTRQSSKRLPCICDKIYFSSHILESETRPAQKKDSRQRGLKQGNFCQIQQMCLFNKEHTRMQYTAGAYEPVTHSVEDIQCWQYFPLLPWGMPCSKNLLTSPQSVSILSILLLVHLFCDPSFLSFTDI